MSSQKKLGETDTMIHTKEKSAGETRLVSNIEILIKKSIERISSSTILDFKELNILTYNALGEIGLLDVLKCIQEDDKKKLKEALTVLNKKTDLLHKFRFSDLAIMVDELITEYSGSKPVVFAEACQDTEINDQINKLPFLGYILNTRWLIRLLGNESVLDEFSDPVLIFEEIDKKEMTKSQYQNNVVYPKVNMTRYLIHQAHNDLTEDNNGNLAEERYSSARGLISNAFNPLDKEKVKEVNMEKLLVTSGEIEACLQDNSPKKLLKILKLFEFALSIILPNLKLDFNNENPQKLVEYLEIFLKKNFKDQIKEGVIDDSTLFALQNLALDTAFKYEYIFNKKNTENNDFDQSKTVDSESSSLLKSLFKFIKSKVLRTGIIQQKEITMIERIKLISETHYEHLLANYSKRVKEEIGNGTQIKERNFEFLIECTDQLGALNRSIQKFATLIDEEDSEWSEKKALIEDYNNKDWTENVEKLVIHEDKSWRFKMQKKIGETIGEIIDSYDKNTYEHSRYVAIRMVKVFLEYAKNHELSAEEIREKSQKIYFSGLLHDIGKRFVDPEILNQPRKLTDEEFKQLKPHPEFGYFYAKKLGFSKETTMVTREHHERFDGNGYPDQKAGDEISLFGKIAIISDSMNAAIQKGRKYQDEEMSSDENRKVDTREFEMQIGKVFLELTSCKGGQFDPEAVNYFLSSIGLDNYKEFTSDHLISTYSNTYKYERNYENKNPLYSEVNLEAFNEMKKSLWTQVGHNILEYIEKNNNPKSITFIEDVRAMQNDRPKN